jgi:hypothetical protein
VIEPVEITLPSLIAHQGEPNGYGQLMTGLILGVLLSATLIGAMIVDWVKHPLP